MEMTGGEIRRNRANNGGGIYFGGQPDPASKSILDGGSILNNDAVYSGGGIMLDLSGDAHVEMRNGTISGNRAGGIQMLGLSVSVTCNGNGGGVFIPGPSAGGNEFAMKGGSISGNVSTSGDGNGVVIDAMASTLPVFSMEGQARITDDVYLSKNFLIYGTEFTHHHPKITITGNLSYSPAAYIRLDLDPTTFPVQVLDGLTAGNYSKFTVLGPSPYINIDSSGIIH
jgi:hypothetical protein